MVLDPVERAHPPSINRAAVSTEPAHNADPVVQKIDAQT
jgi:hypothetical protein